MFYAAASGTKYRCLWHLWVVVCSLHRRNVLRWRHPRVRRQLAAAVVAGRGAGHHLHVIVRGCPLLHLQYLWQKFQAQIQIQRLC